jgi:hypothetical protein
MTTTTLRPWTDLVKLHPDVESGALTEAVFAIDLGAIAANDPNVPVVNRDPEAFFRATYLTADLRKLLDEVLASLAGKSGYNRVLKLRTPFGGGKSHTLAALLHAARARDALNVIAEGRSFADPGKVAVAVFDGEKFDARDGKLVEQASVGQASSLSQSPGKMPGPPIKIRTMWGWLAWQIGGEKAFALVAGHDKDRVAPGGDVIEQLLTTGADGRPILLLLDEVLKYMERAAAVAVLDSTLQRQTKDFFQSLTTEVSKSTNAAMIYSLQWSAREALGNVALLEELDKLAARVDQLREPVTGDEILPILQRRLLGAPPDPTVASEIAAAYQVVITGMQRAHAETPAARQQAEEEGMTMRDRMRSAYPFHPALIDVMRERWTAVDSFQRTRGALRFLASCLHTLKKQGGARPLLGPGEVPLHDVEVRVKFLKELGTQNDYDPVITADIEGPNARAKRIDDRLVRDNPALASVKPATRLATAILIYSFGGLRREGAGESETLPPGVTESELLAACVGPDLDNITATAVLSEIRTSCLYLHYDGARYCFKKDPNVTKLIEDAESQVARTPEEITGRIREMLTQRLAGHRSAIVWPGKTQDLPDEDPTFLIGYVPLEFAGEGKVEQERIAEELFAKYGDRPRKYRNGVGLAIPEKRQIEALRRAVRYLLAIERVDSKKQQLRLSKDQLDQLRERRRTEEAAAESAFRALYASVWLPRMESGNLEIERVEVGGRPLQATGIHERMMELLTGAGTPKVHTSVTPRKIVERLRLGESTAPGEVPRLGVKTSDVLDAFFSFLDPPRLDSGSALRKAIARGVAESVFAYTSGYIPSLGSDGCYQVVREKVVFGQPLAEDEIDFESGFLIMPAAVPTATVPVPSPPAPPSTVNDGPIAGSTFTPQSAGSGTPVTPPPSSQTNRVVRLSFAATRDQLFKTFPALANLAEKSDSGKVVVHIEASSQNGFDPAWLRNAVEEPLDEADVERLKP